MNQKTFTFLTLLLCLLLQSNFIYAQDNFIEVIDNKSIKFSKEGQEKLNRVKNQKLYQEPKIVQFRDIENVIKENKLEFVLSNYDCKLSFNYQNGEYEDNNNYHWYGTLFNEKQKSCYDGSILFVKKDGEIFGTIEGKAKLYVQLPKEDTQTQILIVDSFGNTIQTLDTSKFTQKGEFDISGLPTGLYYISIRSQLNGLHSITIHVK